MKERALRTNPADFVGKVYPTKNYGDIVITAYRKAKDVTVKFLRTGFERNTTMDDVRRARVQDHSVSLKNNQDLYGVWRSMKDRCYNSNHHAYDSYGGRGITVCDEWSEFWQFKLWADASEYDKGLWLDRTDNDKGYSPDNCRWTDVRTQMRNRRTKSEYGPCIYQIPNSNKFHVRVWANGKLHNLGTYETIELCELVRDEFVEGVAA